MPDKANRVSRKKRRVLKWLRDNHLSYRKAAKITGLSYGMFAKIAQNRGRISYGSAKRLAPHVGVDVLDLCEE